ncbi:ADP-ribosylation factor-like protein 6-interacting protein 1 isoform X1 [Babylonia areolata]|uniref:ADP-ribosylation factor-like protein 6-interacting protein 1 isoform X1 n=1 Tax=Babylonia areolata TaxID=304850 RepID=UPI003FD43ED2
MADSDSSHGSLQSEEAASRQQELDDLKKELEGWRGAFGPIMSVLMWERRHHPVIIFAITTLVFVIIWLLEPSVLTTFSLLFLVLICIDFAMPYVSPYLFSGGSTGAGEQQFNDACEKILLLRTHISEFIQGMSILKQEKPKIVSLDHRKLFHPLHHSPHLLGLNNWMVCLSSTPVLHSGDGSINSFRLDWKPDGQPVSFLLHCADHPDDAWHATDKGDATQCTEALGQD